MRFIKILLITLVSAILILTITFFLTKDFILRKIESTIVKKIENVIGKEIDIGSIFYLPPRVIILKNVRIYEKRLPGQGILLDTIYAKFHPVTFIGSRQIVATLKLHGIKKGVIEGDGVFIVESKPFENILNPFKAFSLSTINISRLNISSPFLDLKNLSGLVTFKGNETLVKIAGANIKAGCNFRKIDSDLIKIDEAEFKFFDSYFECKGEIQEFKNPILLLHGSLSLNTKNISRANPELKNICAYLRLDGTLANEIYFKGRINEPAGWELGLKASSPMLKIWDYHFKDLSFNLKLDDNVIAIPLLTAYPYNGVLNSSFKMDLSGEGFPYSMSFRLKGISVNGLAQNSQLKNKNIYGKLDSELFLKGYGQGIITGNGNISVSQANLGPMPILSPLLGNIYGVIRYILPGLKSIEISSGSCDFVIENRKIITDNLLLWGDILNIKARGYIDFDKNLNFDVENEFKEIGREAEDWQKAIVEIVTGFGKFIGRARLAGTLSKPKWKFEYFSGFKKAIGGKISDVLKDIFE
ncbi:MAG: hypothetical protein KAU58_04605 [Candidatus Omnitrophica bacterium]|nr:hypothetical protein [Candidatus Omnitrophota bacterium]